MMAVSGIVAGPLSATVANVSCRHTRRSGVSNGSVTARFGATHTIRTQSSKAMATTLSSRIQFAPRGLKTQNAGVSRATCRQVVHVSASQGVEELPASLKKIVMAFQMVPDPMQRYKQLLYFAQKLKAMDKELMIPENKVEGCVSQVWVHPYMEDGKVYFEAESDSQLTKGLAALLVEGLSGSSPKEILQVTPDFVEMLGLKQSLTPSRNNGFLNMLRLMQKKTLELVVAEEKQQE
eukprot:CAMPEP_0118933924 /NCGR_PEP_ID=MMETSP1169-20130426/13032_1 /TAXON_ID=36882 /ORGANISM="Pyramimonas obovata, Strain CCMP722" /LENGTH=235 /DNA_ID=CAMNT_0006876763 /DNA_START=49 /DNA_END=756 /DNA_ORIENTATION=-